MKYYTLITIFLLMSIVYANSQQKGINVIYGDHHLFTVETPTNWINDKEAASTIGLTNFFYCIDDKSKSVKSYMFANGIDKGNPQDSLNAFVDGDIEAFKEKYPNAKISKFEIGHTPPIIGAIALSYTNLHDRFKEEVVYLETEMTFIVLTFSADNENDYQKYSNVFDSEFIGTFQFIGNDPTPFLEWQKNNQN
ncbi:hypothetical protein KEM09_00665 [Carboxylicivirga mesophila]|uniref:Uncharacterized protein n=1 Tax=Carboxylicivirga mesophila TaxID=1166478 RepID=A0ABS5K5U9_9BACT|nr:hypothetical protein [Carboxylicivirga mesophila]MBS2209896.1 hypothetical protein [Carboxylicivirga mesophila]